MPFAKCRTAVKKWRAALLRLLQLPDLKRSHRKAHLDYSTYRYDYFGALNNGSLAVDGLSVLQLNGGDSICSQLDWDIPSQYNMKILLHINLATGGAVVSSDGLWKGGVEDGYIGLRFKSAINPAIHYYGWLRLSVSNQWELNGD